MENNLVIIPNTIEPYGYETIPILTYPDGFEYRFRFEEEWVDPNLENILENLSDKHGYIILREFETGSLIPLRNFKVKTIEKIGTIYYIQVILLDLVAYDSQENLRKEQLDGFEKEFIKKNSKQKLSIEKNINISPLVFLTNHDLLLVNETSGNSKNKHMENWGNILCCLKNVKFFDNVQFLKILNIKPLDEKHGSSRYEEGALILQENATYEIKIAQFITTAPNNLVPSDIKIESDNKTISILRGTLRAVGKYDILTFIIKVNSNIRSSSSFLDILYQPKLTESNKSSTFNLIGDPRLSIPVKINYCKKALIVKSLFSLGTGVAFFFTSIFPLALSESNLPWPNLINNLIIVGLTTSVICLLEEYKKLNN